MKTVLSIFITVHLGFFHPVVAIETCDQNYFGATLTSMISPGEVLGYPFAYKGKEQTFVFKVSANGVSAQVGGYYKFYRTNSQGNPEIISEGWDLDYSERINVPNGETKDLDIKITISGDKSEWIYVEYHLYWLFPAPYFMERCVLGAWVNFFGPIVSATNINPVPHDAATGLLYEGVETDIEYDLMNSGGQMDNYWYALVAYDEYSNELDRMYVNHGKLEADTNYEDLSQTFVNGLPTGWINLSFYSYHGEGEWVGSYWFYNYPVTVSYIYPGQGGYYLKKETVNDVIGCVKDSDNIHLIAAVHPDIPAVIDNLSWTGAVQDPGNLKKAWFSRSTAKKVLIEVNYKGQVKREADVYSIWFNCSQFDSSFPQENDCLIDLSQFDFSWGLTGERKNGEITRFTIVPAEAYNIRDLFNLRIYRDVTTLGSWEKNGATWQGNLVHWLDDSDEYTIDEDDILSESRNIFHADAPGPKMESIVAPNCDEKVVKANFYETVILTFSGFTTGLQASEPFAWHSQVHVENINQVWRRVRSSQFNSINPNWISITSGENP